MNVTASNFPYNYIIPIYINTHLTVTASNFPYNYISNTHLVVTASILLYDYNIPIRSIQE